MKPPSQLVKTARGWERLPPLWWCTKHQIKHESKRHFAGSKVCILPEAAKGQKMSIPPPSWAGATNPEIFSQNSRWSGLSRLFSVKQLPESKIKFGLGKKLQSSSQQFRCIDVTFRTQHLYIKVVFKDGGSHGDATLHLFIQVKIPSLPSPRQLPPAPLEGPWGASRPTRRDYVWVWVFRGLRQVTHAHNTSPGSIWTRCPGHLNWLHSMWMVLHWTFPGWPNFSPYR